MSITQSKPLRSRRASSTRRIAAVAAGLLLTVGLAACDGDDASMADSDDAEETSQAPEDDADEGSDDPSVDPSDGLEDGAGESLTISGSISSGVETGCVLLEYEGTTYNLVGAETEELESGAEVEVSGTVSEDAMSICQQGVPFEVDSVTVL